jgi:hypothetical protein
MSRETLDILALFIVPLVALLIVFKDYIHFGRNYFTIPDVVLDQIALAARVRSIGYMTLVKKLFKTALVIEVMERDPKVKIIIEKEGENPKRFIF